MGNSKTQTFKNKEYEKQLYKEHEKLEKLLGSTDNTNEIQTKISKIKIEIENINIIRFKGQKVRAKAMHIEYNEKNSKYFLNVEKKNAEIKNIRCLKLENGDEITNRAEILSELSKFYGKLKVNMISLQKIYF